MCQRVELIPLAPRKIYFIKGEKIMDIEKNLRDLEKIFVLTEEKNLIESINLAYLCSRIIDKFPSEKTDIATDMHVAFIILKDYLENDKKDAALRVIREVCAEMSYIEKICEDY